MFYYLKSIAFGVELWAGDGNQDAFHVDHMVEKPLPRVLQKDAQLMVYVPLSAVRTQYMYPLSL